MKQLDKLLIKAFIGPFIVTFAIAMFVLVMQILWVYLEKIAGKGLSFFHVMELIAYKSVGLIPLALPLALLISSVMVLGSLAEHYELSSFKSAGVGLIRIMAPLILFGAIGSGISYACNDYVIPAANIQFGARMYDIQQKKPTLSLDAGTFNEDFSNFAIRIGSKGSDGRAINDVQIYDHSKANIGKLNQIIADRGNMYPDSEGNFFVMELLDGNQYAEASNGPASKNQKKGFTYVRTAFEKYTKIFDLSEFEIGKTSSNLFEQNRAMLATWQLQQAVDSIDLDILERKQILSNHLLNYITILEKDTTTIRPEKTLAQTTESPIATGENGRRKKKRGSTTQNQTDRAFNAQNRANALEHPLVVKSTPWPGIEALFKSLAKNEKTRVMNRARTGVRSILSRSENTTRILPTIAETRVKHVYDLHMKYSMALVCIIFIFIGAPMGAIVRKGGFGYPILVSIIFFVIFIILTIFCRKLAESFVLNDALAGWMPCIVLFPVGLWLTFMAMNDRKLNIVGFFQNLFDSIGKLLPKQKSNANTPLDKE